jgi:hypothetical protein
LLWVVALLVEPGPLHAGSILLIGLGLIALATVAVVGMVVSGARWARRAAWAATLSTLALAAIRPIDPLWALALGVSVITVFALASGQATAGSRRQPAAAGPPRRAVLLTLVLVAYPFPLGLAAWDRPNTATLVVGLSAPMAALWYARVLPGGLIAVRVLWPAMAAGLSIAQSLAPGIVSVAGALTVAVLAWHPSVKHAFHPPRAVGTSFPIPPELAPREVLEAAELDERGNPRG